MKTIIHWRYHHWIRLWLQNSPRNMCPEEINFLFFCLEHMLLVQLNSRSENESHSKNSQLNLVNSCCKGNQVSSSWIGSRVVHFKPKYLDCTSTVSSLGFFLIFSHSRVGPFHIKNDGENEESTTLHRPNFNLQNLNQSWAFKSYADFISNKTSTLHWMPTSIWRTPSKLASSSPPSSKVIFM